MDFVAVWIVPGDAAINSVTIVDYLIGAPSAISPAGLTAGICYRQTY